MNGVNKVTLVGHLGKDPEVKTMQSGSKVCNLSVATTESWKSKDGERQSKTEWHRVTIFNEGIIKVAEQYLKKGSLVYLEGQLETRKWTDGQGVEKYSTEVVLKPFRGELTMLDGAPSQQPEQQQQARQAVGSRPAVAPALDDSIDF